MPAKLRSQVHIAFLVCDNVEGNSKTSSSGVKVLPVVWSAVEQALCAAVLSLLFVSAGLACAQNISSFPLDHKDAWEISGRASEFGVINRGGALLTSAAIRVGVVLTDPFGKGRLRGTFEYTIDWLPVVLMIHPSVIYGFGIAPVGLKWNFLANPPHRPYAEVDFGGVLSTHSIPPGDSTINFTANAGGGLTLLNRGNETLSAGFNFSHLSCGFLCSRNPNLNGVSFVLEYHWLKAK